MDALPTLLAEITASLGRGAGAVHGGALSGLADLLLQGGGRLSEEQAGLIDEVMIRYAPAADIPARARVADRIAGSSHAPKGILRVLAMDDAIAVARPVLARADRLDDQDLMGAATGKGRDHRLAICERRILSELVTDILVACPERDVGLALARNAGARFSLSAAARLVERSREDEALQDLMAARTDLTAQLSAALLRVVRESARARVVAAMPADSQARQAIPGGEPRRLPGEADLADLARTGRPGEVEQLFAILTGLSRDLSRRLLTEPENELLLVVGKAMGWSLPTMRALLAARDPALVQRYQFRRAETTFEAVATATAERVLRFLSPSGQTPLNVR